MQVGYEKNRDISEITQASAIITTERQQERACNLSNGAISGDLERLLNQISRSRHYLTLNISETVRDRDMLQRNTNMDIHTHYSRLSFRMTLTDLQ